MKKIRSFLIFCGFTLLFFPFLEGQSTGIYDDDLTTFTELKSYDFGFDTLPSYFRSHFDQAVDELCQPALKYDLDRPFEEVSSEFQTLVNCVFNDAFQKSTKNTQSQIASLTSPQKSKLVETAEENTFKNKNCFFKDENGDLTSEEITVINFEKRLHNKGFRPDCGAEDPDKIVVHPYSPCRIGEMIWREYCGYQLYLWGKMRDDETLIDEFKPPSPTPSVPQNLQDDAKKREYQRTLHFEEMKKTKRALLDTLLLYTKFEQSYRLHSWYVILYDNLREIRDTLVDLRKTINTYPLKFFNAASPSPF